MIIMAIWTSVTSTLGEEKRIVKKRVIIYKYIGNMSDYTVLSVILAPLKKIQTSMAAVHGVQSRVHCTECLSQVCGTDLGNTLCYLPLL